MEVDMRCFPYIAALLILWSLLGEPRGVRACPSCGAAIPETSGAEDDDRIREAQAYNHSIYLMVSVPYVLLGVVGFMVYRSLHSQAPIGQLTAANEQPYGAEGSPCSTPSQGEDS
jgi:hypothetical protein